MRKTFKIHGIDCAMCASKLEGRLKKIPGVKTLKIGFLTEKLTLEAEDDEFDDVLSRVVDAAVKEEPDCEVVR